MRSTDFWLMVWLFGPIIGLILLVGLVRLLELLVNFFRR